MTINLSEMVADTEQEILRLMDEIRHLTTTLP